MSAALFVSKRLLSAKSEEGASKAGGAHGRNMGCNLLNETLVFVYPLGNIRPLMSFLEEEHTFGDAICFFISNTSQRPEPIIIFPSLDLQRRRHGEKKIFSKRLVHDFVIVHTFSSPT